MSENAILRKEDVTSEIYNPVVVRAVGVAVDIINALIKEHGFPKEIVIEMPRDKNEDEERKRINKAQKENEKELQNIIDTIKSEYGITITDQHFKRQKNLRLKLKLWAEQNHKCVYSGDTIAIEDLINDYSLFEIDHIIPLSISLDDSRNNKVLVKAHENQTKGQRTPYEYINSGDGKIKLSEYEALIKDIYGKDKKLYKKMQNLLCKDDISRGDVRKGFIERNLNDTRYASRVFLNAVQDFFRRKGADTKVKVIRGSFTHQIRVGLNLEKDREASFSHHAIDAAIMCYSQKGYDNFKIEEQKYVDVETGEIKNREALTDELYEKLLYQKDLIKIKKDLLDNEKNVKFWHKVDRKANRQISDETIYGTREIGGKTYKINSFDIRSDDAKEKFKKYGEKSLMAIYDEKTYELLCKIYKEYESEKNPFTAFEKDTGEKVRKYCKKGDGAIINKVKYINCELDECIDISHKYGQEKGSKKVILYSRKPYRTDIYFNNETKKFKFISVKYCTMKYDKGKLKIDIDAYENLLRNVEILKDNEKLENLANENYEFRLSFYKDDFIKYVMEDKDNGKLMPYEMRYLSLLKDNKQHELKYIERKNPNGKRPHPSLAKAKEIYKIVTDILGNKKYIQKEKFSLSL